LYFPIKWVFGAILVLSALTPLLAGAWHIAQKASVLETPLLRLMRAQTVRYQISKE
jgi:hypothetical protein